MLCFPHFWEKGASKPTSQFSFSSNVQSNLRFFDPIFHHAFSCIAFPIQRFRLFWAVGGVARALLSRHLWSKIKKQLQESQYFANLPRRSLVGFSDEFFEEYAVWLFRNALFSDTFRECLHPPKCIVFCTLGERGPQGGPQSRQDSTVDRHHFD